MPRGARLDAPGVLHHVMVRGLEQRVIFGDEDDRRDFVRRLGQGCARSGTYVLAWALLPNHIHLLLRSGADRLSALMRRGRERWSFDERVLGSSAFAECNLARCAQDGRVIPLARPETASDVGAVMRATAEQTGLSTAELASGSRWREVVVARAIVCTTAVKAHGLPVAVVASALGISPRSVLRAVQRRGGVGEGT